MPKIKARRAKKKQLQLPEPPQGTAAEFKPKPRPHIPLPETYYSLKGGFWMRLVPTRFLPATERDLKRQVQKKDFLWDDRINAAGLSLGDDLICKIQTENFVDYAAPLAGYPIGY